LISLANISAWSCPVVSSSKLPSTKLEILSFCTAILSLEESSAPSVFGFAFSSPPFGDPLSSEVLAFSTSPLDGGSCFAGFAFFT